MQIGGDINFVVDLAFAVGHPPLGTIQFELGGQHNAGIAQAGFAWYFDLGSLVEHGQLANERGGLVAVDFNLGGFKSDLWVFANIKEVWVLEMLRQLRIIRPKTCGIDFQFQGTLLRSIHIGFGFGLELLEPTLVPLCLN